MARADHVGKRWTWSNSSRCFFTWYIITIHSQFDEFLLMDAGKFELVLDFPPHFLNICGTLLMNSIPGHVMDELSDLARGEEDIL